VDGTGNEEKVVQTEVVHWPGWNINGKKTKKELPRLQLVSGRARI